MQNDLTYKIPQSEVMKILKLDPYEFQELKRVFNLNSILPISYKQLRGFIAYQNRVSSTIINIEELKLDNFIINENELKILEKEEIPYPKKIKVYKTPVKPKPKRKAEQKTKNKTPIKPKPKPKVYKTKPRKIFTEEEDKKILKFYNSDYYLNPFDKSMKNKYTMTDLCRDVKVKCRKTIARRASELGFTNFKLPMTHRIFTKEEIELLKKYAGKIKTAEIKNIFKKHGYSRSIVSLNVQLRRLDLSCKLDGTNDLSLRMLAEVFGVDTHFFTNNEFRMEALKPVKTNKEFLFKRDKIRDYIINNPYDILLGKIDNKFLIEILTNK